MSIQVLTGGPLWAAKSRAWAQGTVAWEDGRVIYAGPAADYDPPEGARVMDAAGGIMLPGLVNTHCHAAMTLFRGLADDLPLEEWLHGHIFPAEARWVSDEMTEACAALAAAEMLLGGTTTVCDGYFCQDGTARAFQRAGVRAVVAQGIIDFPAPGVPDPAGNLDHAASFVARWTGVDPLLSPALFPHSVYTCSPETLRGAADLAQRLGVPWFTHLAESRAEVDLVMSNHGQTPVDHLERLGLLGSLTGAAHCVWITNGEMELLARRQVAALSCPESNWKLASGIADLVGMRAAGMTVGLGTDGAASNNDLSLWGEARLAALGQKAIHADPAALPAEEALDMATAGGAAALGLGAVCGRLRPGLAADLVLLRPRQPHLSPMYDPVSHLVYAAGPGDVASVWVSGRQVVDQGRLLTLDVAEVRARVLELAAMVAAGAREA